MKSLLILVVWFSMAQSTAPVRSGEKPPAGSQPASAPGSQASRPGRTSTPPRSPEQRAVLENLLRERERAARAAAKPTADSSRPRDQNGLPEGTILFDRPGRLMRSGDRSEFQFARTGDEAVLPDMEVSKNSWLEFMEREADAGATDFVVTGEVSRYRGRSYLTLLSYRRVVDNGNLKP